MPAPTSVASVLESLRVLCALRALGRELSEPDRRALVSEPRIGDLPEYIAHGVWAFRLPPLPPLRIAGERVVLAGELLLRAALESAALWPEGPRRCWR